MVPTTEHDIVPNTSNNIRNFSEGGKRDTPGANGVTGEEREVTRQVQAEEEKVVALHAQAEAEDERVEAETSNISTKRGRGRPRWEKSNMIMQMGEEEGEPKAVGMASISKKRGRSRKDKTNIIVSKIEQEALEEDSEGSMNDYATRKNRRRAKKRISTQILEEESVSKSNEHGDSDDDFGPPAKKRGRRGPKPISRSIAMASSSAVIHPRLVEKSKRRVAKTPAVEVEREGIFDEVWDSEDEEGLVNQWTREHEVVLQSTTPAENALWKRAFQLFNQPAPSFSRPPSLIYTVDHC